MKDYPIYYKITLINRKVITLESHCDMFGEYFMLNGKQFYYFFYRSNEWLDVSETIKEMVRVCGVCFTNPVDDLYCEDCK